MKQYRVADGKTLTRGDNKVFEAGSVLPESAFAKTGGAQGLVELGYLEEINEDQEDSN